MSDKEINTAILEGLKQIANGIFTNEIDIEPGTYTAAELAKGKSAKGDVVKISYIQTNNESILTRSVCVGSFKCEFERKNIFNLIWKFEQLSGTKQKDKAHFVKIETGKADLSFNVEITKEMHALCKCVANDKRRPVMSYVFIDYKKGYLIASNGKHLKACKANVFNIEGETETSVLINTKDLKQLSGVCSVSVSDGKVTISDEAGHAYLSECSALKFPDWVAVVPKVSKNNYIKINEVKEVLSFLKKKEGTFCMYAERGRIVTINFIDRDSGISSQIEVSTENEIPFSLSVMFGMKSFLSISQTWNGGIFLNANYKAVVLTDKNESLCFTMPDGTREYGFHPIDFDFDRSNMISLLEFGEKPDAEPTKEEQTPKENIAPVQSEPMNLPVAVSECKYNILGLYCLLSLVCRAIIYNEVNEVLKRLKMLLCSPVVNVEDFANELQIIDLQPGEVEEIKDVQPGADALPYENQSLAVVPDIVPPPLSRADAPGVPSAAKTAAKTAPCVPLMDAVSFTLWFAVRVWVVSARGTVPAPAANIGCSRRDSVRIRGATR